MNKTTEDGTVIVGQCKTCGTEFEFQKMDKSDFVCSTKCRKRAKLLRYNANRRNETVEYPFRGVVLGTKGLTDEQSEVVHQKISTFMTMAEGTKAFIASNYPALLEALATDLELLALLCAKADDPNQFTPQLAHQIRNTKEAIRKDILAAWAEAHLEKKRLFVDEVFNDVEKLVQQYG